MAKSSIMTPGHNHVQEENSISDRKTKLKMRQSSHFTLWMVIPSILLISIFSDTKSHYFAVNASNDLSSSSSATPTDASNNNLSVVPQGTDSTTGKNVKENKTAVVDDCSLIDSSCGCKKWGVCGQRCIEPTSDELNDKSSMAQSKKRVSPQHRCYCDPGYILDSDNYSCRSLDTTTPYVIYSNQHEIRSVDLNSMAVRPLISGLKHTIALDFYHSPEGDMIFWTDVMDDKIYRGSVVHNSITNIEVVVETGMYRFLS